MNRQVQPKRALPFFSDFLEDANRSFNYFKLDAPILALIVCVFFPVGYLVEASSDSNFSTLIIRTIGIILVLPMFFASALSAKSALLADMNWLALLVYIPFMWGAGITYTAASSDPNSPSDMLLWIVEYVIALFILVQLSQSLRIILFAWTVSSIPIAIGLFLLDLPNLDAVKNVAIFPLPLYLVGLVIGGYAVRNRSMVRSESLNAARSLGSNIAHEMRTPLAGIGVRARAIGKLLPTIIEGYRSSTTNEGQSSSISERQLTNLTESIHAIERHSRNANAHIDMVLLAVSERDLVGIQTERFMCWDLLDAALEDFPYSDPGESALVAEIRNQNYSLDAPFDLMKSVLFYLLKNALYRVRENGSGSVVVTCGILSSAHRHITVEDTGQSIPARRAREMFDTFDANTISTGGYDGLAICKHIIESIGGSISYDHDATDKTRIIIKLKTAF